MNFTPASRMFFTKLTKQPNIYKMNNQLVASEPEVFVSVGEEFVDWAERHWDLKRVYEKQLTAEGNAEACPYSYVRKVFADRINSVIKERLSIK